ncbi:MAG: tyrosine-type recombinase/integrase [Azonexus sp.]|nr:tyrosine-type recombinase/integrase [Azonexus sp.]MCK6412678.1 tyrosine-type recombinase/integrase [Azonexus sp.]
MRLAHEPVAVAARLGRRTGGIGGLQPGSAAIVQGHHRPGQRIGDVLKIRYADIDEDGIFFKQEKTGNRLKVAMTDDLKAAIDTARALHQSVKGLTLFHTHQGKPFAYWTVRTLWDRAITAAGVQDVHIHDICAKAATDAKAQGLDSKTLLGHASKSAHSRYLRSKEIPLAKPVKIRKP